jgi:Fe-S-cluster containining protein
MLKYHGLPRASSGGCGHLLPDNTCKIYNSRPDICNVNTMWKNKYSLVMSWDEYAKLSEEMCKLLVEIDSNRQQGATNVDQAE